MERGESKSGKNRKGLISSVGQRWVAWGGSGNEILPVPFYQPFKAHYSGEGETYKAPALEHISVCLWETERGCCTHASVIDSQFRITSPLSLPLLSFCLSLLLSLSHLSPCILIVSLSLHFSAGLLLSSSLAGRDPCRLMAWERNTRKTVCLCLPL